MKIKHAAIAFALSALMGVGVFVGIKNSSIKEAKAATKTIYLDPNIWNQGDGEKYYAWLFDSPSASDSWGTLTKNGLYYTLDVNDTYTKIIFTRGENTTPSWDIWNQTENLTIPTNANNKFTVTSWDGGQDGKSSGTWSTYVPPAATYNVDVYVDGEKRGTEEIGEGELPETPNIGYGKYFTGWFDNAACTAGHEVYEVTSTAPIYSKVLAKETATFGLNLTEVSTVFTGTIFLYSWDDNGQNDDWPGVEIANTSSITVPIDANVIINKGLNQTEDVTTVKDGDVLKILNSYIDGESNKKIYDAVWESDIPIDPGESAGQENIYDTKYGTFYQLLVYSFADGDGDGIGDFKGLIEHLDYLENLGIGGLYLSPIQEADSYHAYDTTDYYAVNSEYEVGSYTLSRLVTECHNRNIKVILDMVLNHSSYNCAWRTEHPSWYSGDDAFSGMIDFNYDIQALRTEIKNVGAYWLNTYHVDGFRLDAVRWIYNSGSNVSYAQHVKSVAWWNEFYQYCKSVKNDVYMIGEDYIYDEDEIALYQSSGLDSLFDFEMIEKIDGGATLARPNSYINWLVDHQNNILNASSDAIAASFLSNHDRGRYGETLDPNRYVLAGLMNILAPGNSYVYYGDELNLQPYKNGGWDDFYYRTPMPFASGQTNMKTYINNFAPGFVGGSSSCYEGGTADSNASSNSSIYAAYAKAIKLKNNNPILYSGTVSKNGNNNDATIGSYFIRENTTTLTVIYNTSSESKNITFANSITKIGDVSYTGSASIAGTTLTMAPYSVVILNGEQELTKTAKTGLFVRGEMNSWGTDEDYELMQGSTDKYSAKIYNVNIPANKEFKIASADWSEGYGFSDIYSGPSQLVEGSVNGNMKCTKAFNFNIYIMATGKLVFVDADNTSTHDSAYCRGSWNGWSETGQIKLNEIMPGEIYKAERVPVRALTEFKFLIFENDYDGWIPCDTTTHTAGYEAISYGADKNCRITTAGVYDITATKTGAGWNYDVTLVSSTDAYGEALTYARSFNTAISAACDYDGNTVIATLDNAWTEMYNDFLELTTDSKNILKGDLSTSSENDLRTFHNKYNFVYAKYHASLTMGNFIARDVQLSNGLVAFNAIKDTTMITVIVVISCFSLLSVCSLAVLKKKKHNQ